MAQVSASLNGVTASLKLIELPDLPAKGDFSDWLMKFPDRETAAERLAVMIERADPCQVPGKASIEDAILTDGEFFTLELPRKRTILNPWLKEQTISLVPGWRGVGKTWFCMGIVDAVTHGESFGPWQIGEPVPCLYVEAEMAAEDVRARFKELNPSRERKEPLCIYSAAYGNQLGLPAPNLLDEKWRTKMKSILIARNVKLLILDNLASLAPGIDENLKKDNDPISQWLLELRFAGMATIIPHHTNEVGDQRGTSAREDHLDSSITLKTPSDYVPEDGCKFVCHFKKARVRTEELGLIADCQFQLGLDENGQLKWTWGNVRRETKIEILKLMDEGQRQIEVASILGLTRGYVSKVVKSASKDGLLTVKGKLTQSGLRYVQNEQNEEAN